MTTFAELLREYRVRPEAPRPKRRTLSQARLAGMCDLETSYVNRLESGQRMPSRDTVEKLSTALDLCAEERMRLYIVAGFVPLEMRERVLDFIMVLT